MRRVAQDFALLMNMPVRKDRKSTRLNSSHLVISYAVFCLKKKNNKTFAIPNGFERPPRGAMRGRLVSNLIGDILRPVSHPARVTHDVFHVQITLNEMVTAC